MKFAIAGVCFLLSLAGFGYAAEERDDIAEWLKTTPWFAPEKCARTAPGKLRRSLLDPSPELRKAIESQADIKTNPRLSMENEIRMAVRSQAGIDTFSRAYTENLASFINRHYPKARNCRDHLYAAFDEFFLFMSEINRSGGVGHMQIRIRAQVEWEICSSFKRGADRRAKIRYSLKTLRRAGMAYQRDYRDKTRHDDRSWRLEEGLRQLNAAEVFLSKSAIARFRTCAMLMFTSDVDDLQWPPDF